MEKEKIKASFIYEILGKPADYVKDSLVLFVEKLEQKGVHVESKKIYEPKPLEDKNAKDLYTAYAEVELSIDDIFLLFRIVYNTLPSHIEVIYPSNLTIKNFDLTSLLTELALKLHKYDEVAKTLAIEKNIMLNRLKLLESKISSKNEEVDLNLKVPKNLIEIPNKSETNKNKKNFKEKKK